MNGSLRRVPCTIVTGFLGAGKTTLIRHVIANAQGRQLAVIVNEFGDFGIDGEILKGCGNAACVECRERAQREASPTAAIIDSQSVKSAEKGGLVSTRMATMRARRSRARSGIFSSTRKAS